MFDNFAIAGVPLVLGILGLVSFAKTMGLAGKWLTGLSFVLGVIVFGSFKAVEMFPAIKPWVELVYFALAGPAISGVYDQGKEWITGKPRSGYQPPFKPER
jgi:hypothetical protein